MTTSNFFPVYIIILTALLLTNSQPITWKRALVTGLVEWPSLIWNPDFTLIKVLIWFVLMLGRM